MAAGRGTKSATLLSEMAVMARNMTMGRGSNRGGVGNMLPRFRAASLILGILVAARGRTTALSRAWGTPAEASLLKHFNNDKNELTMQPPEKESQLSTQPLPASGLASGVTRRQFLSTSVKGMGLTALLSGLPAGWVGSVFASDAPETTDLKFGIIALTDCSTIVSAHEKGLFKK